MIMKFRRSFRNYYGFCMLNLIKYHWRFCRFQPQSKKLVFVSCFYIEKNLFTTLTIFALSWVYLLRLYHQSDETVFHICPTSKFVSNSESSTAAHSELEVIFLLYKVLKQVSHQIHCEAI